MTIRKTARFEVIPEGMQEALGAIRTFVAHTAQEPGTVMYESWQSADRPTEFLHLMAFADDHAEAAHRTSEAVIKFTDVLYPLCSVKPRFEDWRQIS